MGICLIIRLEKKEGFYMRRNNIVGGVVIILIGIFMLLSTLGITRDINILLLIGACFIAAYVFSRRQLGFLIPGCIIFAIGVYSFLMENHIIANNHDEFFVILLGCAFLVVMLVHTMWIKTDKWGARYWPAIPGGILVVIGILAYVDKSVSNNLLETVVRYGWPVIIIAVGLRMLIWPSHRHRREEDRTQDHQNGNM